MCKWRWLTEPWILCWILLGLIHWLLHCVLRNTKCLTNCKRLWLKFRYGLNLKLLRLLHSLMTNKRILNLLKWLCQERIIILALRFGLLLLVTSLWLKLLSNLFLCFPTLFHQLSIYLLNFLTLGILFFFLSSILFFNLLSFLSNTFFFKLFFTSLSLFFLFFTSALLFHLLL